MKSVLPKAGTIFLIFTLLCGAIYTGVVAGIASGKFFSQSSDKGVYIMKTMKSVLPKAGMIFLIFTLLCGVIYTGVVTGIAQLIFPDNANGSIIEVDGKKIRL